ncbi:MAG: MBL fold metallo-hydrolase [Gemmatimonadetes bacterium]|nr:MBL fold metallo-hydrolase [Gemmatimonadota bacterium]
MHIHFLGGANEVGASSTLITIGGQRILVDAGIRMNSTPDEQLPYFSDLDTPDAVLLTHAHTDHTGALPVLIRDHLPKGVKVYSTASTKAITQVLLEGNVNLERREKQEDKPPLYTNSDVDAALKRVVKVPWWESKPICGGALTATWIPAGHILGASMICIEGERESILMTGDVSVNNQLSIPGMADKGAYQPDVMVMESTYGARSHPISRAKEEDRLVSDVAARIAAGGHVLMPVFAVGRAQEVILILKRAMECGKIPEFPVYIDGMACAVNELYPKFVDALSLDLLSAVIRGEPLFYSEHIKKVPPCDKPYHILSKPCCIVAPSGMLIGGRSWDYADLLVDDPKNLIAITGYQAKGNPGYTLKNEEEWKRENGSPIPVECDVESYQLSAHANQSELTQLVKEVQPRKLFLVHGDTKAREGLKRSIQKTSPAVHVELPQNGDSYYEQVYRLRRVA